MNEGPNAKLFLGGFSNKTKRVKLKVFLMTKVESYGIVQQDQPNSDLELNIETFHRKGYVKISSEYKQNELEKI